MRVFILTALFLSTFAVAQSSQPGTPTEPTKHANDQVTIRGCVTRSSGDYILVKSDPAVSYELQATGKIRLHSYLGQQVEVTGEQSPTLSSSSDAMNRTGSATSVTISVRTIRTIAKECGAS